MIKKIKIITEMGKNCFVAVGIKSKRNKQTQGQGVQLQTTIANTVSACLWQIATNILSKYSVNQNKITYNFLHL